MVNGPAERAAATLGFTGPSQWTDLTLELRDTGGLSVVVVLRDGAAELGRAYISPSMVAEITRTSGEPGTIMVRLMREAPE